MNQFIVLALDALLHLASVALLGVVVVLASKLLTRGFVDAKFFTGLLIAMLLVFGRITLLNYVGRLLPGVGGEILILVVFSGLYLAAFVLVYKLISIPALGTALSASVIVAAQIALAGYVPKLSLQLMPEGQRFAEYAGLANDRTKKLMADAEAFRGQSGGIRRILADALEAVKFFTSEDEQAQLSKDFASGIALYQERKAYMDNMTPEELASYRKAMSAFLAEQGLQENRYSLSNLKNAQPEDLENLANFMQDMNREYGFTNELPKDGGDARDAPPPSAESLAGIAQELSKVDLDASDMAKLGGLFAELGINADSVMAGMASAREDLANIREISGKMAGDFRRLVPDEMGNLPTLADLDIDASREDVLISGGYVIKKIPTKAAAERPIFVDDAERGSAPKLVTDGVAYFMPGAAEGLAPGTGETPADGLRQALEPVKAPAAKSNYFDQAALNPITTEQSVVMIPREAGEAALWLDVSQSISIDAWFAASDAAGKSTIFIEGEALQDGDIWERSHGGETYRFAFRGIEENQITLVALERVPAE